MQSIGSTSYVMGALENWWLTLITRRLDVTDTIGAILGKGNHNLVHKPERAFKEDSSHGDDED